MTNTVYLEDSCRHPVAIRSASDLVCWCVTLYQCDWLIACYYADYAAVRRLVVSRPFKGKMISVKRVAQTCRVLVRGAPPSVTKDYISLYFEKHAATDVTDIQQSDDYIVITFAKFEGDASILILLFGRSFVKQFTLFYRTVILSVCLSLCL